MPIQRPYFRTCRQFTNGSYADSGKWRYIVDPRFAQSPEHCVRPFLMLLRDMQLLFDYVEPSDANRQCYSFRIQELLFRACIEVEANCKAILSQNGYARDGDWNMSDYKKIEASHHLSSYEVTLPIWHGKFANRAPFAAWATGGSLAWYGAYNATKHDRHNEFQKATFEQMIDALCGLLAILSSQFHTQDFAPGASYLVTEGPNDGTEAAIGGYMRIRFPNDWPQAERYDFDWEVLEREAEPFQRYDYSIVT